MALFDSIISGAAEKFGLGDKAGTLLSAILALITNQESGGFTGFLDKFNQAGLGDKVTSWITTGDNAEISEEEVDAALGSDAIKTIADQTGISTEKTTSAIGYMLPQVVDTLTPDGEVPDQESLLSKIGGFLTGIGAAAGAVVGSAAGKAGDAAESVGDAAEDAVEKGKEVLGDAAGAVGDAAGAVSGKVGDAFDSVGGALDGDGDGGSILKWLLPLLLLGLLLALGFMFCSKPPATTTSDSGHSNDAESHSNTESTETAGNSNTAANENSADNSNAANETERTLAEVSLPGDVKLQAYPGGIEDQLVKFVQSDEYKNATDEQLKDKWFDFDDLKFKFGTTELEDSSKRQLDNIVAILKAFPEVKLKIGGYTDKTGDDARNKKLSDDRAKAVKAALEKAGVGAQVPEAEGYGEEFAKVAEDASDEERAPDRKTSVRLIK
ncbi:MAG: YidB family protein [Pyrinomonadaceae bacterium]